MVREGRCDVIVLGAGISGLLLASELSKAHSVIVLEKKVSIPRMKYWVTNLESLRVNPELAPFVESQLNHMDIIAHDYSFCRVYGPFPMWNTNALVDYLVGVIEGNTSSIYTDRRFYNYYYEKDQVVVQAGSQKWAGKLLIDCMGSESPIIDMSGALQVAGYYVVYGRELLLRKSMDSIAFYNIAIGRGPYYVEVFPTPRATAHATVILPVSTPRSKHTLVEEFEFVFGGSHLSQYFDVQSEVATSYGGVIPVGQLRFSALDRIYFFGESGQLNPAATATGFTRMLYHYKDLSLKLSNHIRSGRLKRRDLSSIDIQFMSEFNRKIQLSVFREMQHWTSNDFRDLISQLQRIDNGVLVDILFGDISVSRLLSPKSLRGLIQSGNHILLRNALKAIIY